MARLCGVLTELLDSPIKSCTIFRTYLIASKNQLTLQAYEC